MPALYIITGSNGAGKSSIGPMYLPNNIRNNFTVFDGDLLYTKKLRELFPEQVPSPKEARKMAFQCVVDTFEQLTSAALSNYETFVYEGHFTNDATWDIPRQFKAAGFEINLIFFGLNSIEKSQLRVTERAALGGHFVDRLTLEANFTGNLEMLNQNFRFIDNLTIVDTSSVHHTVLALLNSGIVTYALPTDQLPHWFTHYMPDIAAIV